MIESVILANLRWVLVHRRNKIAIHRRKSASIAGLVQADVSLIPSYCIVVILSALLLFMSLPKREIPALSLIALAYCIFLHSLHQLYLRFWLMTSQFCYSLLLHMQKNNQILHS